MAIIETIGDLRDLKGLSLYAISPVTVFTDGKWRDIMGVQINLHGGVELRVRGHALQQYMRTTKGMYRRPRSERLGEAFNDWTVPATARDPYLPEDLWVEVPLFKLRRMFNAGPPGARREATEEACLHREFTSGCLPCFKRWWQNRAKQGSDAEKD